MTRPPDQTPTADERDPSAVELRPDDDVVEAVPVDPPEQPTTIYGTVTSLAEGDRRPIVPAWMRSAEERRQVAAWAARYGAHVTLYHLTRSPKYAAKLALRAPVGAWRVTASVAGWVFDREGAALRLDAVRKFDQPGYIRLSAQRNARVRARLVVTGVGTALLLALVFAGRAWAPAWAQALALTAVVVALGKLGTPPDRRITDVATVSTAVAPRLTSDVVTRALRSLGLAAISPKTPISYVAPITRDGPGWRADIDLPHGVTVADVTERRDRLASGLRRPLGCVWPEPAAEAHAGRLVLWVGDQDLARAKPLVWPLARRGGVDLFAPFPFGADQRGRSVQITLMFESMLIGAKPRMGKTFALRVVALAAALDARAELRIFELKGTGDLGPLAPCCHHYASGADEDTLAAAMSSLREVYDLLIVRAKRIAGLPRELCPESKVTPALAGRRELGLHPITIFIDECQELFTHPDLKTEAERLAEAIIKRGPALGIMLVLATQRPDAKSLPGGVSSSVGIRFCLRVMDQVANDMVLGTSSYKAGIRATTFSARDRGIGYLAGVADDPQIVRTAYIDGPTAEHIAERARAAREAAGTLSGFAVGEQDLSGRGPDLLDDLRVVFATAERDRMWSEEIVELLTALRPELYAGWSADALARALPRGLATKQIAGEDAEGVRRNRRGLTAEDLQKALAARQLED